MNIIDIISSFKCFNIECKSIFNIANHILMIKYTEASKLSAPKPVRMNTLLEFGSSKSQGLLNSLDINYSPVVNNVLKLDD